MRRLPRDVSLEDGYQGVVLGAILSGGGALLIDAPLRVDEGREWLAEIAARSSPRYLALLDHHPDRVLGARAIDLPLIGHRRALRQIRDWPDTYKGNAQPLGSDADALKRVSGITNAVPELAFSDRMRLYLGDYEIEFWHRPGPMSSSMWVIFPEKEVAFVGDAVTVGEPPYIGEADLEAWLGGLDELRSRPLEDYLLISSRDGKVSRDDINAMARFLRKIPNRLEKLEQAGGDQKAAVDYAQELLEDFSVSRDREELARKRLEVGLLRLHGAHYPKGD